MLRIIVDSGSSIKPEEKDLYGVDILPIRLELAGEEYLDGVNLDINAFYEKLQKGKEFPKTSLPSLEQAQLLVEKYTDAGDEVLLITISSGISGTFQVLQSLFSQNDKVTVFDSKTAVGGIRLLVEEAKKYENEPMEVVVEKLNQLVPKIVVMAIPETLDYLLAGGRLSKTSWMVGKLLSIKPVIGFENGKVSVLCKKRGLKQGMRYIVESLQRLGCNPKHGIIAAYTYNKVNVEALLQEFSSEMRNLVKVYDNLTPSIACHWGPNAFGCIYVRE